MDKDVISRIGDRLTYTLTLQGAPGGVSEPELPPLDGFEVLRSTSSTNVSIINGKATTSRSWNFILVPSMAEEEKEVTIPSAHLRYEGKTYATAPVRVKVQKGAAPGSREEKPPPPASRSSPIPVGRPLFIETAVDKTEVYEGEHISLSFRVFSYRLQLANIQYIPPPTVGFLEENISGQRNYEQDRDGVRYNVIEIRSAIFPLRAGELTIGPAELRGDVLVPSGRARASPFDDFFSDDFFSPFRYERRPFSLRSDPITITVKPLPKAGRPADFSGGVGRFQMNVEAKPLQVKAGEPITLTVKVTGAGNIDSLSLPAFNPGEGFRTYEPEVETRKASGWEQVGGEKIFKQVIIPRKAGEQAIPAVSFSYFDPGAAAYRTEKAQPIPIMVAPAPAEGPLALVEGPGRVPGKKGVALLAKDILYIKENPGRLRPAGRRFYRSWWYWGAHLIPLGLILFVFGVQNRRERLRSDIVFARRVTACRSVRKRFRQSRRWLREGKSQRFCDEVHRAFVCYLGDKLGLPSGAIDAAAVAERIGAMNVSPDLLDDVKRCFESFERACFAPGEAAKMEMEQLLEMAERVVSRLEKVRMK